MIQKRHIPNILTLFRIIVIPLILITLFNPFAVHLALGLFMIAAITDFFDGFLARRWQVDSNFGRMLDPIADKLLIASLLIGFIILREGEALMLVPAMAIILRDIFVSGCREHAALTGRSIPSSQLAKWKTACEMTALGLLLVWHGIDQPLLAEIGFHGGLALLWLAALLSLYTGLHYGRQALID